MSVPDYQLKLAVLKNSFNSFLKGNAEFRSYSTDTQASSAYTDRLHIQVFPPQPTVTDRQTVDVVKQRGEARIETTSS